MDATNDHNSFHHTKLVYKLFWCADRLSLQLYSANLHKSRQIWLAFHMTRQHFKSSCFSLIVFHTSPSTVHSTCSLFMPNTPADSTRCWQINSNCKSSVFVVSAVWQPFDRRCAKCECAEVICKSESANGEWKKDYWAICRMQSWCLQ